MQAIRLQAHIGPDHRLSLDLPADIPAGAAEIIVLYEAAPAATAAGDDFRAFASRLQASRHPRLNAAEVARRVDEERAAWGES